MQLRIIFASQQGFFDIYFWNLLVYPTPKFSHKKRFSLQRFQIMNQPPFPCNPLGNKICFDYIIQEHFHLMLNIVQKCDDEMNFSFRFYAFLFCFNIAKVWFMLRPKWNFSLVVMLHDLERHQVEKITF